MIVYVREGPHTVPDTTLHTWLNLLRNQYGDFTVRVDADNHHAARSARRWAQTRNLPVQNDGIPSAIIVPSLPQKAQPTSELQPANLTAETKAISDDATRTSGAAPLIQFIHRFLPPATIIWLPPPDPPPPPEPPY